jgi:Transglutaminase-like superfamily
MKRLFKALRLIFRRPRRAWLMARIAGWTIVLSSVVRFCSLPKALQILSVRGLPPEPSGHLADGEVSTAVDAVLGMNLFFFKPVCWKRAVLLRRFLSLQGYATTIVFGLQKTAAGELKGHAWLERSGAPVFEPEKPEYTVTYTFPSNQHYDTDLLAMLAGGS